MFQYFKCGTLMNLKYLSGLIGRLEFYQFYQQFIYIL